MALAEPRIRPASKGRAKPRIAPPTPARSDLKGFRGIAEGMGITLMPWQEEAARYLTAIGPDGLPLYREICIVVARQNGKTHLAKPFIIRALEAGKQVMHIAQTRELPRIMFPLIAESLDESLFLKRRGKGGKMHTIWPRYGSGSEEILLANDGSYRIAADNRGGTRGFTNDLVIIDELREMVSYDIIAAVESTTATRPGAQILYLSNAGTDESVILNDIRDRADKDPNLAYLEWSAAPERDASDVAGWLEANPAVGHIPTMMHSLESFYRKHTLNGTLANFETENLCRWVPTMRERLVDEHAWAACQAEVGPPRRPVMAVSMDPDRQRASAVMAWQDAEGRTCVQSLLEGTGNPIHTPSLGEELRKLAAARGIRRIGYDPITDAELAKYFKKPEAVTGRPFANHTSTFVELVASRRLRWTDADAVTSDLVWTAKKEHDESGVYQAVRAKDDRPITASLAAIRAVGLASGPRPASPRVY